MLRERVWDPWNEFRRIQEELEELERRVWGRWPRLESPAVNLVRNADKAVIEAVAPGLDRNSIDVSVTGDTVTIRGERKVPSGVRPEQCQRRERETGKFARTIQLGQALDAEHAQATYRDGILRIEVPWAPETRPRKITVS